MGILLFIRHIFLLGPKHSGKTSAGRELSKLLEGGFVDMDELIEAQTGKSARALFRESPSVFRAAEQRALESLFSLHAEEGAPPLVTASGGGIIDNPGAMRLLLEADGLFLVNVETPAETAWERILAAAERSGDMPPFLETENPRETHRLLHERRAAAYRDIASLTVRSESKAPDEIGREILQALKLLSDKSNKI
ncbi:MAG: shikimate kinase [Treponema sp.]|jgi:shikimate kinase|nr:shikimate kinase [Treponema sp.]